MSTIASTTELCARIEAVVQEHIAASREAALAALQRAFSQDRATVTTTARGRRPRATPQYRSRETLEALQQEIYQHLKQRPGLGAADLSAQLNVKSADLYAPMAKLKARGLVRSVGLRSATRYFPVAEGS